MEATLQTYRQCLEALRANHELDKPSQGPSTPRKGAYTTREKTGRKFEERERKLCWNEEKSTGTQFSSVDMPAATLSNAEKRVYSRCIEKRENAEHNNFHRNTDHPELVLVFFLGRPILKQ